MFMDSQAVIMDPDEGVFMWLVSGLDIRMM